MSASKSQIDRLGERLKKATHSDADLSMLDEYRRSFRDAYQFVTNSLRANLQVPFSGRRAKSKNSIVDKLRRESIRLTQIQDIAGCRIVVEDIVAQDRLIESLRTEFAYATVIDRRIKPTHGYRAVHVVVEVDGKLVEIQVRSELQHLWAELSEKYSEAEVPMFKYGGGSEELQRAFRKLADLVAATESSDPRLREIKDAGDHAASRGKEEPIETALSASGHEAVRAATLDSLKDKMREWISEIDESNPGAI